ncbi:MAG: glycine--tRNA ligase subunit alpha, partial [Candidatus Bathyarchaeia archaeon]
MKLFDEKGYVRRTCPQCNRAYWTLDPNSATCGDQPCTPYGFLDNPPTNRRYTTTEIREMFLSFFEEHQHARIRKYPVLARWRDDVFFVGASVYNFQPWVTEGIIPPPANPLTISQPCIRLTDIDLIGKTGRHLTSFEMMAHHAFNTRDHRVYWTDETAAYCFEFFTERLGVKPEKINFVEDMWVGGGNAGEDLEVVIDGIEVSTLVFMHYKMLNGNLKPIDNLTVDTGYGLERIAWLSNGAPTIYNAIFQPVVTQLVKAANLTPPSPRVLVEVSKAAGQLKSEGSHDLRVARAETAAQLGLQPEELDKKLRP